MSHHKHYLREIAKFAAGVVASDLLCWIWLSSNHLLPLRFLGIVFTPTAVIWGVLFDAILFAILIHYAWHAEVHTPSIRQRNMFLVVGWITGIIALVHLLRIILGFGFSIDGWNAPFWMSWIATIAAGYLSYASFGFASTQKAG